MSEPILHIFIRKDLDSMVPGKAAAQACHAATQLSEFMNSTPTRCSPDEYLLYETWLRQGPGFGTVLTKAAANDEVLNELYDLFRKNDWGKSGVVIDPTYPVRDGQVTHLLEMITCVWIFSDKHISGNLY